MGEIQPYELKSMPGMVIEDEGMNGMLRKLMELRPHFSLD